MRVTWLVCLYPRRWRERYEAEFTALLESEATTPRLAFDVLAGAVRAHRDPFPPSQEVAMTRPRAQAALAVLAVAAVLPGVVFFVVAIVRQLQPTQYQPARAADAVFQAFAQLSTGGVVALLLVAPAIALVAGSTIARRRVVTDADLRADLRLLGAVTVRLLRRPVFVGALLAAIAAVVILVAVVVHAIVG